MLDRFREERERRFARLTDAQRKGITPEQYCSILSRQGDRCGICWKPPARDAALIPDVNPSEMIPRGALCAPCHCAIQDLEADLIRAMRTVTYLRKPKRWRPPKHRWGTKKGYFRSL